MPDLNDLVAIDPDIRGGKPCLRGTRITVYDLLEYLAGGMTEAGISAELPSLRPDSCRRSVLGAPPVPGPQGRTLMVTLTALLPASSSKVSDTTAPTRVVSPLTDGRR
jgi:uncharacterized protein (DUF433 family)